MNRCATRSSKAFASTAILAAAAPVFASPSGLVVLHPTASGALNMTGNSNVHIPAHAVYVNSNDDRAVRTTGNAKLDVPTLYLRGGTSFSGNSHCTGKVIKTSVLYVDPLAGITLPDSSSVANHGTVSISGQTVELSPGYYDGFTSSGHSTITLQPGTYIFGGTGFSMSSHGSFTGHGVTLIMQSGEFRLTGQANVELTPPESGSLTGLTIAQPASNTTSLTLTGGSDLSILGSIYAPNAELRLTGQGAVEGQGPQMGDLVVANTVNMSGLGSIKIGREGQRAIQLMQNPLYD